MVKPKNILVTLAVLFFLFTGYLFINSLEQPKHIHSRDDVPQSSTNRAGDSETVIVDLKKQLQGDPGNFSILMSLGHAYLENRYYEKAGKIFSRAVKVNPGSPEAHTDLGVALRNNGQIDEALKQLKKVTADFPEYADGWLQLGTIYRFDLKKNRKALDCFQKFLILDNQGELAPRVKEEIRRIEAEMNP
ncbi:MAG TPA: tetratricopeptide repeat protein [Caldithrix sp.]|nr:tetratricopeptide repeat protein [Caldithrix sp.]